MTGTIALQGGGPFTANDDLDRQLLGAAGISKVVVLPTADAFEGPQALVDAATAWGTRLGVEVEPLMVMTRSDALEAHPASVIAEAQAVYLAGDSPIHLHKVLVDTPVWAAVCAVVARGGLVVGVAGSAAALCDPMTDPRGGAFTIGLGLITGLAVATEIEGWTAERLNRTVDLAPSTLALLPTGAALLRRGDVWDRVGEFVVHGDLPH